MPGSTINTSCALKCTTEPAGPLEGMGQEGHSALSRGTEWTMDAGIF